MVNWTDRLKAVATPQVGAPWVRRLSTLLLIVAVVLLASRAADITWQLLTPSPSAPTTGPSLPSATGPVQPLSAGNRDRQSQQLAALADYPLFGRLPEDQRPSLPDVPIEAPETRLNLSLRGVLAVGGEGEGAAIIGTGDGQKVYLAGAQLPGDATLARVHRDRVILSRGGEYEMLRLQRERLELDNNTAPTAAPTGDSPFQRGARPASARAAAARDTTAAIERRELESLRDELRSDPRQIAEMVQVRPVLSGGSLRGFRIAPREARGRSYFQQAGLRAGDIVLAVNGAPATDTQQMQQLVDELERTSQIRLRIERDGSEQEIVLRID